MLWGVLTLADAKVHGLWTWPVAMAIWALLIFVADRRTRHQRAFTEQQIAREIDRMR